MVNRVNSAQSAGNQQIVSPPLLVFCKKREERRGEERRDLLSRILRDYTLDTVSI